MYSVNRESALSCRHEGKSAAPAAAPARGKQAVEIARALRDDIIAGAFEPNAQLRQERLAERFEVSRMPVREALRLLEAEGLVNFDPNKSARVAPVSGADLRELCEMRIAAETLALRIALPELTNAQIERAEAIQAELETAPLAEAGLLNAAFHRTLYAPSGRPRLLAHIDVLGNAADRYLRLAIAGLDYAETSNREHRVLLQACRARDSDTALACLEAHIEDAGAALAELMNRPR